jgi:tetratricopeptide (TPR) repeat protein
LKRTPILNPLLCILFLVPQLVGILPSFAAAQEASQAKELAEALAEEAVLFWDRQAFDPAIEKFRESLRLYPKGETYRDLGDLYAERDMHAESIAAYRSAIQADSSLEPDLRLSIGLALLWMDRF